MVVGQNNRGDLPENYNPEAPGEPNPALQDDPVPPVPGVHKETRGEQSGERAAQGHTSEGSGHTSGGGRDSH